MVYKLSLKYLFYYVVENYNLGVRSYKLRTTSAYFALRGTYWVRAIIDSNCFATDSIHVFYNPSPTAPIISQNGNVLSSSSSTGNQWFLNGEAIPGDTNQSYTVPLPITSKSCYSVTITNIYGCSATSDAICYLPLGISELMKNRGIYAYPNPAKETISIAFDQPISNDGVIEIWSIVGKKLLYNTISKDFVEQKVNVSSLSSGIYFYVIKLNGDKFSSGKLTIIK